MSGVGAAGVKGTCGWSACRSDVPLRRKSAGQALIEFALFFTFLMLVLAGATDIAFLEDAHVNVVFAARQGARTGAVLGTVAYADCAIVGAIHATLVNQSDATVTQITIFQAGATGSSTGYQQVYSGSDYCTSTNPVTWAQGGALSGSNWPPSARNDTPFQEDSLGVQVRYTYQFRFNLWGGGTLNLADAAVFPVNVAGYPTPVPTPTP